MKKIFFILLVFPLCILNAQTTYLHCGKLFDTKKGKIETEKTVIVKSNIITSVVSGYVQPESEDIKVIDLTNKTVFPGFIDMHVHIESETSPKRYIARFTDNEADIAFNSVVYAKRTLMAGFTTVRDLGGTGVNIALRKAIDNGKIKGPRIFTSGKSIATTGGHADPTNGMRKNLQGNPGPKEGVINSLEDAKKAVRQRYKNGADCIKITATGGVLSVAKNGRNPQFTVEEIKAITQTAKDYDMHVAAHAHGDRGMQRAILGGVKTIEHGTFMSEATMDLMKKYDVYLVPTISAGNEVGEKAKVKGYYPEIIVPKALEVGPQISQTFAKAYKKGVPIAFGTDAGVFPHGENAKEFELMVKAGMPEVEALQTATITNAKLLKMEDKLGQIAPNFYADIIAVEGNPLENISILKKVDFIMKNGKVYKNKVN